MSEENRLIIEQLNKFGRVPHTSELLKMIEQLQQENQQLKEENQQLKESKSFREMINDKEWVDYKFEYENNQKVMKDLFKQLFLYKSVIDEVNEFVKTEIWYHYNEYDDREYYELEDKQPLLEILDKVNKESE